MVASAIGRRDRHHRPCPGSADDDEDMGPDQVAVVGVYQPAETRPDVPSVSPLGEPVAATPEDPLRAQLKVIRARPDAEHLLEIRPGPSPRAGRCSSPPPGHSPRRAGEAVSVAPSPVARSASRSPRPCGHRRRGSDCRPSRSWRPGTDSGHPPGCRCRRRTCPRSRNTISGAGVTNDLRAGEIRAAREAPGQAHRGFTAPHDDIGRGRRRHVVQHADDERDQRLGSLGVGRRAADVRVPEREGRARGR